MGGTALNRIDCVKAFKDILFLGFVQSRASSPYMEDVLGSVCSGIAIENVKSIYPLGDVMHFYSSFKR